MSAYLGNKGLYLNPDKRIFGLYGIKYYKDKDGYIIRDEVIEIIINAGLKIYTFIYDGEVDRLYNRYTRINGAEYYIGNTSEVLTRIDNYKLFKGLTYNIDGYFTDDKGWAYVLLEDKMYKMDKYIFNSNWTPTDDDVVYYDARLKSSEGIKNLRYYVPPNIQGYEKVRGDADSKKSAIKFIEWTRSIK